MATFTYQKGTGLVVHMACRAHVSNGRRCPNMVAGAGLCKTHQNGKTELAPVPDVILLQRKISGNAIDHLSALGAHLITKGPRPKRDPVAHTGTEIFGPGGMQNVALTSQFFDGILHRDFRMFDVHLHDLPADPETHASRDWPPPSIGRRRAQRQRKAILVLEIGCRADHQPVTSELGDTVRVLFEGWVFDQLLVWANPHAEHPLAPGGPAVVLHAIYGIGPRLPRATPYADGTQPPIYPELNFDGGYWNVQLGSMGN